MISIIIISFFFFLFIAAKLFIQDGIARCMIYVYLGWWSLCLIVSTFNFLDMYPVTYTTYAILLLNVFMFTFGFIIFPGTSTFQNKTVNNGRLFINYKINFHMNRTVISILLLLSIYLFYYFSKYNAELLIVGSSEARNMRFFVGPVFSSTIEVLFFNFIIEAVSMYLVAILAFCIVFGYIKNIIFCLTAINLYFFSGIGAGRGILINAGFAIGLLFLIKNILRSKIKNSNRLKLFSNQNIKNTIKHTLILLSYIVAVLLLIAYSIYLTAMRMNITEMNSDLIIVGGNVFAEQVLSYCTGSFRLLDYAINNPSYFNGHHYGSATFAGFDEMAGYVINLFGLDYQITNHFIGDVTGKNIYVGGGLSMNALYTCVYRFYFDFNTSGVIIFSFIFGLLVRKSIFLFNSYPCISTLSIFLTLVNFAVMSTLNFYLASPAPLIFIFTAYFLYRKEKTMNNKLVKVLLK